MSGPDARARTVYALLLVALVCLIGRTGYIQIVRGDELAAIARRQHFRRITVPAARGRILDRHGRPIAATYHSRSVAVDPQVVEDVPAFAAELALLLGEDRAAPTLAARIDRGRAAGRRFVYLRRCVDRDLADRVAEARLRGLDLREEPRREYPQGPAAAAVIGVVGPGAHGRQVGLTGLELLLDDQLRGVDGSCSVFRSGRQESLHLFPEGDRPPRPGRDVVTTLDVALQQVVEEALDALVERFEPQKACALVMEPSTGAIRALAGRPALDPAEFPHVGGDCLRIPAAQDSYEPGSTIKPLIMAWALTRGAVHAGQRLDCGPGWKRFGPRILHDVRPNGVLDLEHVLIKSSNIGMAQVGLALGMEETCAFLHAVGFGRPTGIEVSAEQSGAITQRRKWKRHLTLVSVSMGHELAVTPVQLAAAYATLLNGGFLVRPTLLETNGTPRPARRRVPYSREAIRFVRDAMEKVVADGTGRRARVVGLRVGGKTGTSEKYREPKRRYVSSFVGFAPVGDPRMLVIVVADEPKRRDGTPYGGVVAAPAVGEILRRGLPLIASSESGVRRTETLEEKVRVAAVHWSSVNAGERNSPAPGRIPDSGDAENCRSGR